MARELTPRSLRRVLNLWPPFLFAGVRVRDIAADWRSAEIELRMHWWNRNYVGSHFGGTLFSMTDPFWMLLALHALGKDYIVWDKAGAIDFVRPGRGTLHTRITVDEAALDEIRAATASGAKYLRWFETEILDGEGAVVARVRKQLYVRLKQRASAER